MRNFARQLTILRHALAPRLILAALLPLVAGSAPAQQPKYVPGQTLRSTPGVHSSQTPQAVLDGTAIRVGHYEPTQMLRLAITLLPPHPVEEGEFLEQLQNKTSPLFHQYLTPEDWTTRFGPSVEDEQAVADWALSQGFTITYRSKHRMVVDVEAPAGVIEKALGVTINQYQVLNTDGTPGETRYSADRDPLLPSSIASVVGWVGGLNSFERVQPASGPEPNVAQPDYVPGPASATQWTAHADAKPVVTGVEAETSDLTPAVTAPKAGYYQPSDIWSTGGYDYLALMNQGHCCNPLGNSAHSPMQTSIAVAGYDPLSLSDVANFQAYFSYLSYNIETIGVDGGLTCDPSAGTCGGEASLDNEWVISTANSRGSSANTAKVYYYNAPNGDATDVWTHIMDDGNARVMSSSWGAAEPNSTNSSLQAQDSILATMAGEGWTLLFSSGDQGSTGACNDALKVIYPASDPNVIAVGGTTLELYSSEVGWTGGTNPGNPNTNPPTKDSCSSNGGGSTGGFSDVWPTPGFQSGMGFKSRAVPDMALNASIGQDVYVNNSWAHLAGTSIATPMLAGFMAQENAYLLSLGDVCGSGKSSCGTLGDVNYAIYTEGKTHDAAHIPFYDITSGCSSNDVTIKYNLTAWCAGPGFDEVTGWGSANMLQLAWAINWQDTAANGTPYVTFNGPATNKWYNSNQNVSWTIEDYSGSSSDNGVGIAGFNQGWDSVPPDSTTEARILQYTNQESDTFYAGPQFPNAKTGCLALASGEGCSGGVTQGCHTAHVRGFNNQGETTGDSTYGPVCYDTVAPTITLTSNPDLYASIWWAKGSSITLAASDPGGSGASGIAATYYGVDNAFCSTTYPQFCNTYTGAFSVSSQGAHVITYFSKDNAGNFSSVGTFDLWIDLTPPVTTIGLSGNLVGNFWNTAVTAKLTATDSGGSGLKNTLYSVDGGVFNRYDSAFTISTPGVHTIKYYSDDNAGNVETTNTTSFTIESPTTTTFTASPTTSTPGTSVTLKASVAATLGGTPTGNIIFYDGNTALGTVALSGNAASLTTTKLPVGNNVLSASYTGATYYVSSVSLPVTASVTTPTTTTLTASANPSKFGQIVTFNATVKATAGAVPTGTVTFKDGPTTLGTASVATNGVASFMATSLSVDSHSITAVYGGNSADLTSTSAALSQVVTAATTTTKLTTDLNPAKFGYTVLLNATVSAATGATPSGQIAFKDGTTTLATLSVNAAGVATYAPGNLAVGSHSITAVYVGDTDDATSTSAILTQTIQPASTTTIITSSLNPAPFGSIVTLKATVAAGSGTIPTGTVTFKDGTTVLGTATLASGSGDLAVATFTPGTHSITAVFTADADDSTSTSAALTQSVTPAGTTTALKTSASSAKFGSPVTFTATVKATTSTVPTGTVTFKDVVNGVTTTLGSGTLTSGVASFTTSSLAVEIHSITAVYIAGTDDATSTSPAVAQTITATTTTTTVVSSLNPAAFGATVKFAATVVAASGSTPTGTVTFKNGNSVLGTATLASGTASFSTSTLAAGSHSITAVYTADTDDATSTSAALSQTITAATTTTTLASTLAAPTFGTPVTFTASVKATTGTVPTGAVTFKDGSITLGTETLSAIGSATFETTNLAVGTHSITVVYEGTASDATSASSAFTETVKPDATTTTLTSSLNPATHGTAVKFTATVTATAGPTPAGTVTFKDGTATLGTGTLSSGVATYTTSALVSATHAITAVYAGSTDATTSTSSVLSQVVH